MFLSVIDCVCIFPLVERYFADSATPRPLQLFILSHRCIVLLIIPKDLGYSYFAVESYCRLDYLLLDCCWEEFT